MDDLFTLFGPRNAHWVKTHVMETLAELNITTITPSILKVIEDVLSRLLPVTAGTPIGLLMAFELSKTTSQTALNSGHILDSMSDAHQDASLIRQSFEKSLSFSGLISQRKCSEANFMRCTFKEEEPPIWPVMEDCIYAIPLKDIDRAVSQTDHIDFITQPYVFENKLTAFVSNMNMYSYLAKRDQLETLLPFMHILALVACQVNPPAAYTRHGLKKLRIDFVRRASFEDVMSAILDGSLNVETVSSESIIGALMTATKSKTGTTYFDLLQPPESTTDPGSAIDAVSDSAIQNPVV